MKKADIYEMYHHMGISREVFAQCQEAEDTLTERFAEIDRIAEYNQAKVLYAMQKNQLSEAHLYPSTGYGYNISLIHI